MNPGTRSPLLRFGPPIAALSVIWLTPAAGDAPIMAEQLVKACRASQEAPQSAAAASCLSYVRGFLDGAIAAGARVAVEEPADGERPAWLDRAARTRVGTRIDQLAGRRDEPHICLPESLPAEAVIRLTLASAEEHPVAPGTPARELIERALRAGYPCT